MFELSTVFRLDILDSAAVACGILQVKESAEMSEASDDCPAHCGSPDLLLSLTKFIFGSHETLKAAEQELSSRKALETDNIVRRDVCAG